MGASPLAIALDPLIEQAAFPNASLDKEIASKIDDFQRDFVEAGRQSGQASPPGILD